MWKCGNSMYLNPSDFMFLFTILLSLLALNYFLALLFTLLPHCVQICSLVTMSLTETPTEQPQLSPELIDNADRCL